jgi:hypothetical protein
MATGMDYLPELKDPATRKKIRENPYLLAYYEKILGQRELVGKTKEAEAKEMSSRKAREEASQAVDQKRRALYEYRDALTYLSGKNVYDEPEIAAQKFDQAKKLKSDYEQKYGFTESTKLGDIIPKTYAPGVTPPKAPIAVAPPAAKPQAAPVAPEPAAEVPVLPTASSDYDASGRWIVPEALKRPLKPETMDEATYGRITAQGIDPYKFQESMERERIASIERSKARQEVLARNPWMGGGHLSTKSQEEIEKFKKLSLDEQLKIAGPKTPVKPAEQPVQVAQPTKQYHGKIEGIPATQWFAEHQTPKVAETPAQEQKPIGSAYAEEYARRYKQAMAGGSAYTSSTGGSSGLM